jgi:hypothetical protein
MTGFVTGIPKVLLRFEGLLVLATATIGYARLDASWWLFAILMVVPDLSMIGYLGGKKIGATLYNAAHWYALPLTLIGWGMLEPSHQALMMIGLVWSAHIGMDRALGAGLKYADGFGLTHLGQLGAEKKLP